MAADRWDRLAGRLVMAPPRAAALGENEKRALEDGLVGHLILFPPNLKSGEQSAALLREARSYQPSPGLVGVDHEGGLVSFAARIVGRAPSPMHLGAAGDPDLTELWCRSQGARLRAAGFHMVFAPCLDVQASGGSAVIGTRSFGGMPRLVSLHGRAAMRGYRKGGVHSVIKHFPGHGGVRSDSHIRLPRDDRSAAELTRSDLLPFRDAIREGGVEAVMIAHVAVPAWGTGRNRPASASPAVIRTLLRERLGFEGVCVSDAIEMAGHGGGSMVEESFQAGIDLFCSGRSIAAGARIARSLGSALREGRIDRERAERSAARIGRLLKTVPPQGRLVRPPGGRESEGIARHGRGRFRPIDAGPLLAIVPRRLGGRISAPLDWEGPRALVARREGAALVSYSWNPGRQRVASLIRRAGRFHTVVLGLIGRGDYPPGQRLLLSRLKRLGQRLIAVSLLDPEPLIREDLPESFHTFDFRPETLEALFRSLLNHEKTGGKLPLSSR